MIAIPRPASGDYAPFYEGYISRAPVITDAVALLAQQRESFAQMLGGVPEERAAFRYAVGKWSVKDLVGHVSDTERVMSYRLLRIGRGDATPLAGFEEDDYAREALSDRRPLRDLADEWMAVRLATERLVAGMPPEAWPRRGVANNQPVTAAALVYIILGHLEHHRHILRDRYQIV